MGFMIRKTLTALLMPLPAALLLGTVGWVMWSWGKKKRRGQLLVAASLLGLATLAVDPVATRLAGSVEGREPAFPGDSVGFVVVLGSGHVSDPRLPVSAQLSSQALYRLTEGVRIHLAQPWSTLVLSGHGGDDPKPNAQVYGEMAQALGVDPGRMVLEPRPTSTAEEAEYLEPLLSGHRFALVTSATHMPRAVALFEARGLDPVPAPTGHLVNTARSLDYLRYIPHEENLQRTRAAWYEFLGRLWAAMRGDA
jgi:uncharacterized SAM-binding protein YcdF (DUF218 family)